MAAIAEENAAPAEATEQTEEVEGAETTGKVNRTAEKKARKAMQKLAWLIARIMRVTAKKSKNILFVISKPDVFKSPTADTYVFLARPKSRTSVRRRRRPRRSSSACRRRALLAPRAWRLPQWLCHDRRRRRCG